MKARLVTLALAASLGACTESATIQGRIVVGPGDEGLAVFALLWQFQMQPRDPADPASPLVEQLVPLQPLAVGTSRADGGSYQYTFHSLAAGRYVVGGWVDAGDDREITTDPHTIDSLFPIELDPLDAEKRKVTRDVYVGLSAPDRATIRGTLHLSAAARRLPVSLWVLDGPLNDAEARVLASVPVTTHADDVPFAIYNLPLGNLHLLAIADVGDDGDLSNDLVAISTDNPVFVSGDVREANDRHLWLDRQAPDLGTIRGRVKLNAPMPGATGQFLVYAGDPTDDQPGDRVVALRNVTFGPSAELEYELPSLPLTGGLYVGLVLQSVDEKGRVAGTSDWYRLGHAPSPIALTSDAPVVDGINFELGVGRLSGGVVVRNAAEGLLGVWLVVTRRDQQGQLHYEGYMLIPVRHANGHATAEFDAFGLRDGTFDVNFVLEFDPYGTFLNAPQEYVFSGHPPRVTIANGSRERCDFEVTMAPSP